MTTNIQKWGNSQGIRLPKFLLDSLNWSEDEEITITAKNNSIIIEQAKPKKRPTIDQLFENYNGNYQPEEIDWGEAQGSEVW